MIQARFIEWYFDHMLNTSRQQGRYGVNSLIQGTDPFQGTILPLRGNGLIDALHPLSDRIQGQFLHLLTAIAATGILKQLTDRIGHRLSTDHLCVLYSNHS